MGVIHKYAKHSNGCTDGHVNTKYWQQFDCQAPTGSVRVQLYVDWLRTPLWFYSFDGAQSPKIIDFLWNQYLILVSPISYD